MENRYAPVIVTDELIDCWSALADDHVARLGAVNWTMIVRSLIAEIGVLKSTSHNSLDRRP